MPSAVRSKVIQLKEKIRNKVGSLATPVLQDLTSPDTDGSYTVSWDAVNYATGYVLEEDNNSYFTSPVVVYLGTNISADITGKPSGTYYYRVMATNNNGTSGWSATKSIIVVLTLWTKQLGSSSNDYGMGLAIDGSGNIYNTGYTSGSLEGNTSAGGTDMFLLKFSPY